MKEFPGKTLLINGIDFNQRIIEEKARLNTTITYIWWLEETNPRKIFHIYKQTGWLLHDKMEHLCGIPEFIPDHALSEWIRNKGMEIAYPKKFIPPSPTS